MAKLTISNFSSLANESSFLTALNAAFTAVETAMENTLSRDGTTPNTLSADLDANSQDILNVNNIDVSTFTIDGVAASPFDWEGNWATSTAYVFKDTVTNDGSMYVCKLAHTSGSSTEPGTGASWTTYWDLAASKGADGAAGATGPAGADGADGADGTNGTNGIDGTNGVDGAEGTVVGTINYTWSASTSGDPTAGYVGVNNASMASVTSIRLSETDSNSGAVGGILSIFDDAANAVSKAVLKFQKASDVGTWLVVNITSNETDSGGYRSWSVDYVAHDGTFAADDAVYLYFSLSGNDGAGAVDSVFNRTGAVTAQSGDYTAAQVTNAFDKTVDDSDDITEGAVNLFMSVTESNKLAAIENNATQDQTAGEIKTAYESNTDTNALTDALLGKLNNIESNATQDQTDGEIKIAYENNADTNAFTDALLGKLNNIESNATQDQTNAEIETAYNAQVAQVSGGEKTAGTETAVRRFAPQDIHDMIDTHGGGGAAGGWQIVETLTAVGTENELVTSDLSGYTKVRATLFVQPDVDDTLRMQFATSGPTYLGANKYAMWQQYRRYIYNAGGAPGADPTDVTTGLTDTADWMSINSGTYTVASSTTYTGLYAKMIVNNFGATVGRRMIYMPDLYYTTSTDAYLTLESPAVGLIEQDATALTNIRFYWGVGTTDFRSGSTILIEGIA